MGCPAISEYKYVTYTSRDVRCLHNGLAQDGITTFDILPSRLRTKASHATEILLEEFRIWRQFL